MTIMVMGSSGSLIEEVQAIGVVRALMARVVTGDRGRDRLRSIGYRDAYMRPMHDTAMGGVRHLFMLILP